MDDIVGGYLCRAVYCFVRVRIAVPAHFAKLEKKAAAVDLIIRWSGKEATAVGHQVLSGKSTLIADADQIK